MRRFHLRVSLFWFCGWGFSSPVPPLHWLCRKSYTSNVTPQNFSVHKSREQPYYLLPLQPGKATRQQDRIISPMASDGLPHDSLGPHLSVSTITLSALAVTIVAGRMYGRMYLLRIVGSDDYCIVIAVLMALWLTISLCLTVRIGAGMHTWDVPPRNLSQFPKAPPPHARPLHHVPLTQHSSQSPHKSPATYPLASPAPASYCSSSGSRPRPASAECCGPSSPSPFS